MKFIDVIRTANGNLLRSKLRTLLTISAIFVGAFTLTLTTALGAGAQQYLDRQLGNVTAPGVFFVTQKFDGAGLISNEVREYDPNQKSAVPGTGQQLTRADVEKLDALEGVREAKANYSLTGEYLTRGGDAKKFGTSIITQYNDLSLDLAAGRLLTKSDRNSLILPENYLEPLGFATAQDAVNQSITLAYKNLRQEVVEKRVTIVGVMKKSFVTQGEMYVDDAFAVDMAAAQGQGERFLAAIVTFAEPEKTEESMLKARIEAAGNYSAISFKEQIATINTIISAITTALNVVGAIALLAASFGIINTLLMSVYERTQEVGLMKALGMRRAQVFMLFAVEAVLVGFWGSVVAVLAGWGVSQLASNWASNSFLKDFEGFVLLVVTPMNALFVIALIMLIAFLAGTLPALKASRLNPIEALRSE